MASIKLKHTSGNGTILNSPAANRSSDITLKLPSTTGSAGQVLQVASANHSSTNAELEFAASSGTTINNNADNRIITGSGTANTLEGEANATFDGNKLTVTSTPTDIRNPIVISGGGQTYLQILTPNNTIGGIRFGDPEDDDIGSIKYGHGNNSMRFNTNTSDRMIIDTSGNIGAPSGSNIYNASDERLKKNIVTLDKGLTSINSLRPVSFNWIDGFCDEEKETLYGFIAQEVKTVDTNLISQFGASGTVEVEGVKIEDTLRVNEKFITPVLVKAIQELSAKVTTLETEKAKLQTDLTALAARVTALEAA